MKVKVFLLGTLFVLFSLSLFGKSQICTNDSLTISITACNSFTWTNGITYTSNNNSAKDTFVNAGGCDSIVTLNLTILESSFDTLNLIACDSVISPTNKIYKSTGTYNDTLVNAAGCDSIITTFLTIGDTTLPTVLTKNTTLYLDQTGNASITASDIDNGSVDNCNIATRTLTKSSFDCADIGANTVYLIVTDVNGNVDLASAIITVQDTFKPIVVTQLLTITLDSTGNASIASSDVDNGSTDNCNIATKTLSKSSFDCADIGINTVYLIVTDVNGNVDSASTLITVQDTLKPIVITQTVTISLDSNGNTSTTVSDVDNGSSDNCSIATRTLSKSSFDCFEVGSNSVFLVVTDVNGNTDSASATIIVQDTIKPIVVTQSVTVSLDSNGNGSISISDVDNGTIDNCGIDTIKLSKSSFDCSELGANTVYLIARDVNGNIDSASVTVTVQDTIKPSAVSQSVTVSLDSTGNASIASSDVDNGSTDNCNIATKTLSKSSFDCADIGINTVYLIVTDVNGNVDSASTLITVQDTLKPIVITQTVTISLDSNGNTSTTVSDVDNGSSDNCSIATRTLSKSSFDCFEVGSNSVFLVVTDVNGNTDSASATIIVQDTIKPIVVTQSVTVSLDSNGNGSISISDVDNGTIDNCGIDTIKLSKSSFDCSELGANTVYLIARDVNGNIDSASVTVTVQDTIKPSAVSQSLIVNIDSTGIAIVNPMDADNGSSDNCNIATRTLSKSVFLCSDVGVNSVYLIVTDDYGNIDSASVTINVLDTIKPSVLTQSVTVSLDASGNGSITPTDVDNGSTDNCSIASRTLSNTTFDCSDVGPNTVYLIVTDVNGNVDSASALVTVIDIIKPTVLTQALTVSLDASGNASITTSEVDNGSTDNCTIDTMTLSKSTFDCSNIGVNSVLLTVTDVNGNTDLANAIITVQDTLKPLVVTQPVTVSLDANGSGSITITDVDNGSTDNCAIASITLSKSSFDCSELGANTVYLIVTDVNGNLDSASALITVQDLIKPTVVTSPNDVALGYCDATYSYPLPTGDDNCSVTVTQVSGLPPGSTFPVGVTVNTFEISDPSGNTVSTSFTVDVRDRYMPFTITDLSLCKNTNKIGLTKGYDNIIFIGSGVEPNSKFFNPNSLDPGIYTITAEFLDSMGCTTNEQFEIEIRSIPVMPSIKRIASDQIVTTIKYDNYQWYRNGEELMGENKQSLRVNELGIYSVIVSNNENCSQTSEGYGFGIPVNEENVSNQGVVKVFPNPTRDFVFIQINDNEDSHLLIVADALGNQLISQETNTNVVKLDISTLAPGNYFLNIFSGTTNETIVIVKK